MIFFNYIILIYTYINHYYCKTFIAVKFDWEVLRSLDDKGTENVKVCILAPTLLITFIDARNKILVKIPGSTAM